jgi:hypothetical protein
LWGAGAPDGGSSTIRIEDLKEWLSYIASDELQGRAVFSSGLSQAASYITDHLRAWGVRPAGDPGSYLQTVSVRDVKAISHSTITVRIAGQVRTFADGDAIAWPKNAGGKRQFTVDHVEFAGYGLDVPAAHHVDLGQKDVKGSVVVWLGSDGPKDVDAQKYRLLIARRHQYAVEQEQAAASVGPDVPAAEASNPDTGGRGARRGTVAAPADFTTAERLDKPLPPTIRAKDAFFEFLFSHAHVSYDQLKRKAAAREPLPAFRLDGVTMTFKVDVDYEIVRTQLTQNVVGVVDGADPALEGSYVAVGAHYDHVGKEEDDEAVKRGGEEGRAHAPGHITSGAANDHIWNGADDDGSGTVALMALARTFAAGPRPRRSLLFIWHTGEEAGRYGSLYFADYPTVPLDRIVAQLNIDMIGRNRDDKRSEANTVYLVGSDRISTELHTISRAANDGLPRPMKLDYEFNDPSDGESLYTRSDHYSYASKGIPVIFFTTGLHVDYHANTDEVSKIEFDKMLRVTELVYETSARLANLDHAPARDNQGARSGKSPVGSAE